ncbi:MAG: recombinase family protein [Rhodospirillales bacterium]|nr:recombinase family protein [Rhodospirillales bacterium]
MSHKLQPANAVIYARVSSTAQVRKGQGLGSQETRCREFARMKGYEVDRVFADEAVSGSITTRPGMQAMLAYLSLQARQQNFVVIIDDISRLARDIKAHLELRDAIASVGARLESPSIEFGEDSDSILVENLLASVSQHQRQKNAEQTKNRMRARAMNGYWVFGAPRGYSFQHKPGQGKILVRDEPLASIITEALEGFASGRFGSQVEVRRFLERQPDYPKDLPNGEIRNQRVTDLLTQPLYAGYLELPRWGVSFRKAQHEGLISLATFEKIQELLRSGAKTSARKDINADFPLRGFVVCSDCETPLTACWSKSKTGDKHPYYLCPKKGCASYRKSIRRNDLESDFDALIAGMRPEPQTFERFVKELDTIADGAAAECEDIRAETKNRLTEINMQIETLLDRIMEGKSETLITSYERRVEKLERERLLLNEKLGTKTKPRQRPSQEFEPALNFLRNPLNLWRSDELAHKQAVIKMLFAERPGYKKKTGVRTPIYACPVNALTAITSGKSKMAHPGRFELPTF